MAAVQSERHSTQTVSAARSAARRQAQATNARARPRRRASGSTSSQPSECLFLAAVRQLTREISPLARSQAESGAGAIASQASTSRPGRLASSPIRPPPRGVGPAGPPEDRQAASSQAKMSMTRASRARHAGRSRTPGSEACGGAAATGLEAKKAIRFGTASLGGPPLRQAEWFAASPRLAPGGLVWGHARVLWGQARVL